MGLSHFFNNFERFDIFQKVQHGTLVHRSSSGLITLFGIVVMVVLLFDELSNYFSAQWVSSIGVDTRSLDVSKDLYINIDITLPGMTCDQFGLDIADITGDLQLGADRDIKKASLRSSGKKGCRMSGTLKAHRVDGEFHIAFGRIAKASPRSFDSITATQRQVTGHMHQFTPYEMMVFNASHIINHISYGEPQRSDFLARLLSVKKVLGSLYGSGDDFAGGEHPMDGTQYIVTHDTARIMYFIKVVPTTFVHADGRVVESYQMSHKVQYTPVVYGPVFKQPGIFFRYELSPYHVTSIQKKTSFAHMFSSCCAIIGGVFVVLGFVSSFVGFVIDFLPFKCLHPHTKASSSSSSPATNNNSSIGSGDYGETPVAPVAANNNGGNEMQPIGGGEEQFLQETFQQENTYDFTAESPAISQVNSFDTMPASASLTQTRKDFGQKFD